MTDNKPKGFEVIAIDSFGAPDEQGPYSMGEYSTLEEAQAVALQFKSQSFERVTINDPNGNRVAYYASTPT
jgi:hypothetical protein